MNVFSCQILENDVCVVIFIVKTTTYRICIISMAFVTDIVKNCDYYNDVFVFSTMKKKRIVDQYNMIDFTDNGMSKYVRLSIVNVKQITLSYGKRQAWQKVQHLMFIS